MTSWLDSSATTERPRDRSRQVSGRTQCWRSGWECWLATVSAVITIQAAIALATSSGPGTSEVTLIAAGVSLVVLTPLAKRLGDPVPVRARSFSPSMPSSRTGPGQYQDGPWLL